jgi:hypothetical protein
MKILNIIAIVICSGAINANCSENAEKQEIDKDLGHYGPEYFTGHALKNHKEFSFIGKRELGQGKYEIGAERKSERRGATICEFNAHNKPVDYSDYEGGSTTLCSLINDRDDSVLVKKCKELAKLYAKMKGTFNTEKAVFDHVLDEKNFKKGDAIKAGWLTLAIADFEQYDIRCSESRNPFKSDVSYSCNCTEKDTDENVEIKKAQQLFGIIDAYGKKYQAQQQIAEANKQLDELKKEHEQKK